MRTFHRTQSLRASAGPNRRLWWRRALLAIVAGLLAVPAVSSGEPDAASAGEPPGAADRVSSQAATIAVLLPNAGDRQALGRRTTRALGLLGATPGVVFELYDTSALGAAEAYRAAVDAGAVAVLGPLFEDDARSVYEAAASGSVPVFFLSGIDGLEGGRDALYRLRTSPGDQARALAAWLVGDQQLRTAAVLAPRDGYGEEATTAFVQAFNLLGGSVVNVVRYAPDERDGSDAARSLAGTLDERLKLPLDPWRAGPEVRPVETSARAVRPDVVFFPDYPAQIASFLPHLAFHGLLESPETNDVRLAGLSGWSAGGLENVAHLASGAHVTSVFEPTANGAAVEAFVGEYEVRFGERPTEFDAQVYDAAAFVLEAVQRGGSHRATSSSVAIAAEELWRFSGVCGDMWLSPNGGVVREVGVWQVDGYGLVFNVGEVEPEDR